jgi:hypothetical protein
MILQLQHRRPDGDIDTYHLKPGRRYHLGRGSGCEVRILDLKLSRKHAALEFIDGAWQLIDLCSTNGCRLRGETMVGTSPLNAGDEFEIGQTSLVIHAIEASTKNTPRPLTGPVTNDAAASDVAAQGAPPTYHSDEFRPSEGDDSTHKALTALAAEPVRPRGLPVATDLGPAEHTTPAAIPVPSRSASGGRPAVRPVVVQASRPSAEPEDMGDTVATLPMPPAFVMPAAPKPLPSAPQVAPVPTTGEDRTYFITVLGRRLGPLSRTTARDLKARELKGTLSPADLDGFPQA